MDLEVVGRHALFFDDDAMAAFVNSSDALVEWHSLQIDRYDVRHLLSAPPPSRRRNRTTEPAVLDDLSLEAQLDHERYLDLPSQDDQPDAEEDKKQMDAYGFHAVAFSYGNTDDSTDQKNADVGTESSGFIPHFPVPGNLLHSLPSTEKLHQIIARTAMFVSKHGGQSEIILRVKQGDNPTFGFLMPGHQLHAYFRYLVEHPELLNPESDGNPQDDEKEAGNDHIISNGMGGALSLLGSVYGTGEEEDGHDSEKTGKDVLQDNNSSVTHSVYNGVKNIPSQTNVPKDESGSRNPIISNKEKALTAKKKSSIGTSKSVTVKVLEGESRLVSANEEKAKKPTIGMTAKNGPVILEPPPEIKRLMDKIVEFIMRNGKQFEATLIEQDSKHGRFPFLLPSDKYHSYYLKVLERAQESKSNGKGSYSRKDDRSQIDKKASAQEKDSAFSDLPLESDKKEKFKMVIGKSKKDTQELDSKGTHQEYGATVDAASAAAILQAATRGIRQSSLHRNSSTSSSGHLHASTSEDGLLRENTVVKSDYTDRRNGSDGIPTTIARTVSVEVANEADSSETHLTKEQKLKAERLKRAKMFVAMLKNGEVPFKAGTGTSRGSSLEPPEPVVLRAASIDGKEREGSCVPPADVDGPATGEMPERNYFNEEQPQRQLKRKYRSRSGHEDDDNGDMEEEHNKHHSKRDCGLRSRGHGRDFDGSTDDDENDEGESSEEERDQHHKHDKSKHRSRHSLKEGEHDGKHKKDKNHKRSRKKHHSRKRHSSNQEEDENDYDKREKKHSRKKHRSHHSSHHSREKHGHHQSEHPFRDKDSPSHPKHGGASSDDEHRKESCNERNDLEEGEISSRMSEESRGIALGRMGREASIEGVSSSQRASSQPPETTTEVPDDLRAKIRAMLMETRL